jgi:hypothetical protein
MLFNAENFVFVPVSVLVATAVIAVAVSLLVEWRTRGTAAAPQKFRPVLVHDRNRQTLIRSRGLGRAVRPNIRVVYNGG